MELDISLLVQIINFLLLILFLNVWLYRPIRGILARRKEEFGSLSDMIESLKKDVKERQVYIEEGLKQARQQGFVEKEMIKGQGAEEERGIVQKATSVVEEKIKKAKAEIEKSVDEIRKNLEGEISAFSEQVAEKILGRRIQ